MRKTARVVTAPARLRKAPGVPTPYCIRTDGDAGGEARCKVIETDPEGGDMRWSETLPGVYAAVGGVHQLARAANTRRPWWAGKHFFHKKVCNDDQEIP